MESTAVIVLAAGLGKRMRSSGPKACIETMEGLALVEHVLSAAARISPSKLVVVTGHQRELVEERVSRGAKSGLYSGKLVHFANQPEQLGTGHAVKCALPEIAGFKGTVVILYGDVPLIQSSTIERLINLHRAEKATISLITNRSIAPNKLGRIVRDKSSKYVERIVETVDCSPAELLIDELNSGIYAVDSAFLAPAVNALTTDNAQKEYYLTEIVGKASREGQIVQPVYHDDAAELQGVNTPVDLASVNEVLRQRRVEQLLSAGVVIVDPKTTHIGHNVSIAPGAVIGPNVQLLGSTEIESGVVIEGSAYLKDCKIAIDAVIRFGVRAESATIGPKSSVGPFAHLRPGTVLGCEVRVGNFVETKNSELKDGSKAPHLAYLGDTELGEKSNFGAGSITCNYDGQKKERTKIGKNSFIGSNSTLVAPVEIHDGAYVGAASIITEDVPADSLVITRAERVEKPGWAKKHRNTKSK